MSSWSDIPVELIPEITKRLDVVDVFRSNAVCTWWHSVPFEEKKSRKYQIPWLMLSSSEPNKVNSRYFYSLSEHKLYEFHLPEIVGQHCVGSSHGYLLSIDHNADLIATNPLAKDGARLQIPPTSTFSDVVGVVRDDSDRIIEYKCQGYSGVVTNSVRDIQDCQYQKAILSPSLDCVVALTQPNGSLAFARIGDRSWTFLNWPHLFLNDMIFHKGRLHVINFMGTMVIFDLNLPSVEPVFVSPRGPCASEYGGPRRYLIESPCKEKLFLVCRIHAEDLPVTCNFKVFLLDNNTYLWKRIYNLEDISFFLGFNYSMAFSAREFPCIKKNCIYFTNDYKEGYIDEPENASDEGVFCLDDSSVKPVYDDNNLDQLKWPPPIWFMPTLQ